MAHVFITNSGEIYIEVEPKTDMLAMSYILKTIRKDMAMIPYAIGLGIDPRVYTGYASGVCNTGKHISSRFIKKLLDTLTDDSEFSEEEIMAAHGYIKKKLIEEIGLYRKEEALNGMNVPEKETEEQKQENYAFPDFTATSLDDLCVMANFLNGSSSESADPASGNQVLEPDSPISRNADPETARFLAFVDKISIFSAFIDNSKFRKIRLNIRDLYKSESFNKLLDLYCSTFTKEERDNLIKMREYFIQGIPCNIPKLKHESKKYFDMICEVLF